MTSKAIDKENTSGLFAPKNFGLGKSLGGNVNTNKKADKFTAQFASNQVKINSTPVLNFEKNSQPTCLKELSSTASKQKRAPLGEILNPTNRQTKNFGVTPKINKTLDSVSSCKSNSQNKLSDIFQSDKQKVGASVKQVESVQEDYPEVERFIGSKYDSFDDLFPEGKLSELFIKNDIKFHPNLNKRGGHCEELEEMLNIVNLDCMDSDIEFKKLKKSFKKMSKKEMKETNLYQELPSLDDLMPKIFEDDFF